jgi:hypothetical protein
VNYPLTSAVELSHSGRVTANRQIAPGDSNVGFSPNSGFGSSEMGTHLAYLRDNPERLRSANTAENTPSEESTTIGRKPRMYTPTEAAVP